MFGRKNDQRQPKIPDAEATYATFGKRRISRRSQCFRSGKNEAESIIDLANGNEDDMTKPSSLAPDDEKGEADGTDDKVLGSKTTTGNKKHRDHQQEQCS